MKRIAVSGTGFIGRGLVMALEGHERLRVSGVLTRREPGAVDHPRKDLLRTDLSGLLDDCDLLVECSGDVLHSAEVILAAMKRGRPVVTMNSEFHVTVGSALLGEGYLTEGEGDQPGCLAALDRRVRSMGFQPVVYGNIKGFLNPTPTPEQMDYWGSRQGISLPQVTAFTDGSKVQIEQAFAANGLGADILADGLCGPKVDELEQGAFDLARQAEAAGDRPVSDYVLKAGGPPGVFIAARHQQAQSPYLEYLKLGSGPHYLLLQPFHLCHLEMLRTIEAALDGEAPLLTNSERPRVGVRAVAKRDLAAGEQVARALGSFDFRGEAVPFGYHRDEVPLCLLQQCELTAPVAEGQPVHWDQVRLPGSLALDLFRQIRGADGCT
jgi:predicted homoserine dehydrogenase-like protein